MDDRPSGTVTFLFTDIEGSTRLLRALGPEGYRRVRDEHRQIVREGIAERNGTEIDTQGDSFFVAFGRAEDAARAAVEIQRRLAATAWPGNGRVRVRMGLHSTGAVRDESGYVGIGVHRAARISSAAHGGQVLVSGDSDISCGQSLRIPAIKK